MVYVRTHLQLATWCVMAQSYVFLCVPSITFVLMKLDMFLK